MNTEAHGFKKIFCCFNINRTWVEKGISVYQCKSVANSGGMSWVLKKQNKNLCGLCGKTGFTLVEIIVSITILAIVFLSLYQFFFKSYSFSRNVHQREVALLLARKKAEHTLAGIESEFDTVTVDTLDGTVYKTILKTNEEIPTACSIKVYVNKERILVIQLLKP